MKLFILKLFVFTTGLITITVGSYYILDVYYNLKNSEKTLFIWGDSQVYQGIDLLILKEETSKKVYTSAIHGAGPYNFLVFTEQVPNNSDVIISLSEPMMIRPKNIDRDKSRISIRSLYCLFKNNYSQHDIFRILHKNKIPNKMFIEKTEMYNYTGSINYSKNTQLILEGLYSNYPISLKDKQNIFLHGIKKLKAKNCNITFIEFPLAPVRLKLSRKSSFTTSVQNFKHEILNQFEEYKIDTIAIDNSKELMYDTSHLNKLGAKELTEKLGEKINVQKCTTMYIVHWRD